MSNNKSDKILKIVKGVEPFDSTNRKGITKHYIPCKEMFVYESVLKELIDITVSEADLTEYDEYTENERFIYLGVV